MPLRHPGDDQTPIFGYTSRSKLKLQKLNLDRYTGRTQGGMTMGGSLRPTPTVLRPFPVADLLRRRNARRAATSVFFLYPDTPGQDGTDGTHPVTHAREPPGGGGRADARRSQRDKTRHDGTVDGGRSDPKPSRTELGRERREQPELRADTKRS